MITALTLWIVARGNDIGLIEYTLGLLGTLTALWIDVGIAYGIWKVVK